MEKVYLMAFSLDYDTLVQYAEKVESIFDRKNADHTGPVALQIFKFSGPLNERILEKEMDTAPKWVKSLELREKDYSRLRSFYKAEDTGRIVMFGRKFVLSDQRAVQEAMSVPLPGTVCLHVKVDTIDQHSGKHAPYTYDPGRDHVTDSD